MRRVLVLICVVAIGVGCTDSEEQPIPTPSPTPAGSRQAHGPAPTSVALPTIVLRADLGERPAEWERVTFIPFGDRPEELGYKTFPTAPSSQPSALAAAADGSFWIDDRWKLRVAHYSSSGTFLGSAGPLESNGWDLAIVEGQIFVLVEQMSGTLGVVNGTGVSHVDITHEGKPLFMFQLISTVRGLVAQAGRVAGGERSAFHSFVALDPPSPVAAGVLPGLPLAGNVYFNAAPSAEPAHPLGDQDYDLTFTGAEIAQTQPVQVELIAHEGAKTTSIPAEVGLFEPLPVGDDVLMYVEVAPTRPDDAEKYGGGRWLLRVGSSPILWERLPSPDMTDELHHRHVAVGPDGTIYLMVTKEDGMLILKRPPSGG